MALVVEWNVTLEEKPSKPLYLISILKYHNQTDKDVCAGFFNFCDISFVSFELVLRHRRRSCLPLWFEMQGSSVQFPIWAQVSPWRLISVILYYEFQSNNYEEPYKNSKHKIIMKICHFFFKSTVEPSKV